MPFVLLCVPFQFVSRCIVPFHIVSCRFNSLCFVHTEVCSYSIVPLHSFRFKSSSCGVISLRFMLLCRFVFVRQKDSSLLLSTVAPPPSLSPRYSNIQPYSTVVSGLPTGSPNFTCFFFSYRDGGTVADGSCHPSAHLSPSSLSISSSSSPPPSSSHIIVVTDRM